MKHTSKIKRRKKKLKFRRSIKIETTNLYKMLKYTFNSLTSTKIFVAHFIFRRFVLTFYFYDLKQIFIK